MEFKPSKINFEKADQIIEKIHSLMTEFYKSPGYQELEKEIILLAKDASETESVSVSFDFKVFDSEKVGEVKLYEIGRNVSGSGEPYDFDGGDALAKYISNGRIITIPNGVCPHCLRGNVSSQKPKCDACGYIVDESIISWG